ncbi:MAG: ATP-binding protein [Fimbriimonadales bacterium]|nr:ATP-binding protein [Fimbriimonadales bacterium]
MNPVERQLMVLLTARLHGSGNEVAHPVMILSAPGTGKTTLWTSLMRFTDMLAESSLAPFRMLVVDVQAAVHSIAEVLGAQVATESGLSFVFNAELNKKLDYCKQHGVPIVLVFDEATKSPQILQSMLSLVTTGTVAGRDLGVPFRIVLLGNRHDWEREMSRMGSALVPFADRFLYYVTTPEEEDQYLRAMVESMDPTPQAHRAARARELLEMLARAQSHREREAIIRGPIAEYAREARSQRRELAGLAGEIERMRERVRYGESAEGILDEHPALDLFLQSLSDTDTRLTLRDATTLTNYRLFRTLVTAMLEGQLTNLYQRFKSDPDYMPNFGEMHSDQKHMSPRRAMILADQLSLLLAMGYDLESPETQRFLASNIGTPHINAVLDVVREALKPREAESLEAVLDDLAVREEHHVDTAHQHAHVTPHGDSVNLSTFAQWAYARGAPLEMTVPEFEGRPIHTIGDLIDALAELNQPPHEHEQEFSLPLEYHDITPEKVYVPEDADPEGEVYYPGWNAHQSASLTKEQHLLHLAGLPGSPSGWAVGLEGVDPQSPIGRGVRAVLQSVDPQEAAERLQDLHKEIHASAERLDALLKSMESGEDLDTLVPHIHREAHRATGGAAILSMFHTPVYDSETGHEITPEEIADPDQRKFHQDKLEKRRQTLSSLSGHAPEQVDALLTSGVFNAAPYFASARGKFRELAERHWETVKKRWRHLTVPQRKQLLHALQLVASWGEPTVAPYGVFSPTANSDAEEPY